MTKLQFTDLIRVQAIPSNSYALVGVKNTIDVLFNIITQEIPNKTLRQPLNLAIVLDRSGSMDGEGKLENSKKSIIGILSKLTPSDLVHFVTYESEVQVVFQNVQIKSESDLKEIIQTVEKVTTEGLTNLGGGLLQGISLVTQSRDKTKVYNERVFLFSDGRVNVGISDKPSLFKMARNMLNTDGISLTTFGLGSDYDEELMRGLADNGGGAYYFIENGGDIDRFVSRAMDGLIGLVGTQAILIVRGRNTGLVTKIWGQDDDRLISGAQLGDLRESNTRQVLVRLEVSPRSESQEPEEILVYNLEFTPLAPGDASNQKQSLSGSVKLRYTTNENLFKDSVSAEVDVVLTIQTTAEAEKVVLDHLEKGRVKEALQVEQSNFASLQRVQQADQTGQVSKLMSNIQSTIQTIQTDGADSRSQKKVHHGMYMKRRLSVTYTDAY